jgi:hypothetical protein
MRIIRFIIRKTAPTTILLVGGWCLAQFINLEVWLVNENPYFNGADLLAILLLIGLTRVVNKIVIATLKGSDT